MGAATTPTFFFSSELLTDLLAFRVGSFCQEGKLFPGGVECARRDDFESGEAIVMRDEIERREEYARMEATAMREE